MTVGRLINLPTLELGYLQASRMTWNVKGSATEGGRNSLGQSASVETSGGGILTGSYSGGFVNSPEAHEYLNRVAARLNGSYRFMNIPILAGWSEIFPLDEKGDPQPYVSRIPYSDGALFDDGAGYSQETVLAVLGNDAALNAGQIMAVVVGAAREPRGSIWFSMEHSAKGHRAYRSWDAQIASESETVTVDGVSYNGVKYLLSLDRPLRQAAAAGTRLELVRPLCVMKFPTDFTLAWESEGYWRSSPTLMFEEAF